MRRHWSPCRVCGEEHTNPASSSICSPCGQAERDARMQAEAEEARAYEESAFGQFMSLPEDERWRMVFDWMKSAEDALWLLT